MDCTETATDRPDNLHTKFSARLQYLKLQSLERRRLNQDLIMCYKIVRGMIDVNLSDFFYIVWF